MTAPIEKKHSKKQSRYLLHTNTVHDRSNRNIVERGIIDISYTHIQYMTAPIEKNIVIGKVDTSYTQIQYMTALLEKS